MSLRAIDILTDDPNRKVPLLSRAWPVIGAAAFGFGAMVFLNASTRRPYFSGLFSFINRPETRNYVSNLSAILGIQYHILAATIGGFSGYKLDGWRDDHMAERDAVLKRYVELHPEDFPDQGETRNAEHFVCFH